MAKRSKSDPAVWGWRWKGTLEPAELRRLLPTLRDRLKRDFAEHGEQIARMMVTRIRSGLIARDGQPHQIPGYSKAYTGALKKIGHDTSPDLTLTGNLLNHLRGSAKVKDRLSVELWIRPYGRCSTRSTSGFAKAYDADKPTEERPGYKWRKAYAYTAGGKSISVPGGWIRMSAVDERKQRARNMKGERGSAAVYNAHLATYLSYRIGYGKWQTGGKPPGSFLTLTAAELAKIASLLRKGQEEVAAQIIRRMVSKQGA